MSARLAGALERAIRRPDRGILTLSIAAHNEDGAVIQDGTNLPKVRPRNTQAGPS